MKLLGKLAVGILRSSDKNELIYEHFDINNK